MIALERLVAEMQKIDKADLNLRKRRNKLERRLMDHRGAVVLIDGCVYCVSENERPNLIIVGDLSE
jgi:hypothetical protein